MCNSLGVLRVLETPCTPSREVFLGFRADVAIGSRLIGAGRHVLVRGDDRRPGAERVGGRADPRALHPGWQPHVEHRGRQQVRRAAAGGEWLRAALRDSRAYTVEDNTVYTVSYGQHFVVSGGEKGDIRVWDLHNRALVSLCTEHKVSAEPNAHEDCSYLRA
eukprot:8789014-Pyramimonas_sp.AAC.1